MLIYNHKKEFLGINDVDLNRLGFKSLEDLVLEVHDFADLFVKKPGFVHNFKHVNWIDFIACADSLENTQVLIRANSRDFQCNLSLETVYLTSDASAEAFIVNLNNLRELRENETEYTPVDTLKTPIPKPIQMPSLEAAPQAVAQASFEAIPKPITTPTLEVTPEPKEVTEPPALFIEESLENVEKLDKEETIDLDFDDHFHETSEDDLKIDLEELSPSETEHRPTRTVVKEAVYDNGYIYDPNVASSELGLPVELIEEFIEDFVAQANDFKNDLYNAHNNNENDQVKILSHKLKGVAANLRIEDALETLTIMNTSANHLEIEEQLDIFYKIISKLSGEKTQILEEVSSNTLEEEDNNDSIDLDFKDDGPINIEQNKPVEPEIDFLDLEFKEDSPIKKEKLETLESKQDVLDLEFKDELPTKIKDSEVPDKINMPELADDDFLLSIDKEKEEGIEIAFIDDEAVTSPDDSVDLMIEEEQINDTLEVPYDKSRVAQEIGLDQESFNELFKDYLKETQDLTKSISTAITTQNTATWKHQAQKLKSMSDNMRMPNFDNEIVILTLTKNTTEAQNANEKIIEKLSHILKMEV